jgi:hypothetical protein
MKKKEAEKKLKYKNLSIEIQGKRNMKCFVIQALESVELQLKDQKNLETIPRKHAIDSLPKKKKKKKRKTAVLGTSHITREVLQSETCNLRGGMHQCFKRSTRERKRVIKDYEVKTVPAVLATNVYEDTSVNHMIYFTYSNTPNTSFETLYISETRC